MVKWLISGTLVGAAAGGVIGYVRQCNGVT
jgi:hypothetical protein